MSIVEEDLLVWRVTGSCHGALGCKAMRCVQQDEWGIAAGSESLEYQKHLHGSFPI